ncbi:MAG TPA: nucleotidyltransferase domain-containing protein [Saprospiraceae bacterium]|nr:nucleotidyltransferase domain-containing protein [Saprospiraceae bacterium]HMP15224.1 nucleotidyltransferase domain-containing protein [Saprospiraceae bacterium]
MPVAHAQIEKIAAFFTDKPVLKAYLFGSLSRGEGREDSDVDLLVELDYTQPIGLEFIQMQLDLQDLLGKKVNLVSARGLSKYIQPVIEKEKQLIYVRSDE